MGRWQIGCNGTNLVLRVGRAKLYKYCSSVALLAYTGRVLPKVAFHAQTQAHHLRYGLDENHGYLQASDAVSGTRLKIATCPICGRSNGTYANSEFVSPFLSKAHNTIEDCQSGTRLAMSILYQACASSRGGSADRANDGVYSATPHSRAWPRELYT